MALVEMDFMNGESSVKSEPLDNTTTQSQTITIPTGLTSIKKFTLIGNVTLSSWTPRYRQVLTYNADRDGTYYSSACIYGNGSYGGQQTIGTATSAYSFTLSSISGGNVVLTAPSTANYCSCENLVWYAE